MCRVAYCLPIVFLLPLVCISGNSSIDSRRTQDNKTVANNLDYDMQINKQDPFELINRAIFRVNTVLDFLIIRPVAASYERFVFAPIKNRIKSVLDNLATPITFVNDILSGEGKKARSSFLRFLINSTVGLFGLFDPASKLLKEPAHSTSFRNTFSKWGLPNGPYIVLPVLGPTDVLGILNDTLTYFIHPFNIYMRNTNRNNYINLYSLFKGIEIRSALLPITNDLYNTYDPYSTFRVTYLQNKGIIEAEETIMPDDLVE